MHALLRKLLLISLISLCYKVAQANQPTGEIVWFHSDFPPISILSGPFKGQGAADRWESFLIQNLTDFRHEQLPANTLRLHDEMKRRDNACNPAYLKTPEREKFFIFSNPIVHILPNGLVSLRSNKALIEPFLNGRREVRLAELLSTQKLQIAVARGRSFGHTIDTQLKAGNAVQYNASDIFSSGFLQLANHQGVDAVVGYAIELTWSTRRFDLDPKQFWFIPVEGATELIPVHIACSRSAAGEQIIARINDLVRAGKVTEIATHAYREWLPEDIGHFYDR
ncbi:MAG: hypothetical protein H6R19_3519, partial [Proteobacteria bacterium]|nr:hypothetical protein [Pseudomonadota bacterium]